MMDSNSENSNNDAQYIQNKFKLEEGWSIRPCFIYKEEYNDCKTIKARFHQYFIHGESIDCEQWYKDYLSCEKFEDSNGTDVIAGQAIVQSERERRQVRLKAHYANDVWKKRSSPPKDWSKPLPEWLEKKNENTFLEVKQKELSGLVPSAASTESKSYCSIM